MSNWSTRRKATYLSVVLSIFFILIITPVFILWYKAPTCFDGKKNGSETGIDCGGKCQLLCSFEGLDPIILWSRAFKITDGVYSAVAYIQNPNINSDTTTTYIFRLYDSDNVLIGTKENQTYIPKNKTVAIFEPNIDTQSKVPARVTFEFTQKLVWRKTDVRPVELTVTQKSISGETTRPRIDAIVENNSTEDIGRVEVVAIVYDDNRNAIASSRTFIDKLNRDQSVGIAFTWLLPFLTSEYVCRVPLTGVVGSRPEALGVMLAVDRSGSMIIQGTNPPQPLTDVKNAVMSFVRQMRGTDQVGVVSFATTASDPVDSQLSKNYEAVIQKILNIEVGASSTQYTNIADGIEKSMSQFFGDNQTALTNRVIILLTDGIANQPEKEGDKTYPETIAIHKSEEAKTAGVEIFTIGLGNDINVDFLKKIASGDDHYFSATSTSDLKDIYEKIAVRFCSTGPSVVEIIPQVMPNF